MDDEYVKGNVAVAYVSGEPWSDVGNLRDFNEIPPPSEGEP